MDINPTNKKTPRPRKAKKDDWNGELVYVFRNVPVKCEFDGSRFSDARIEQALLEVESLSREICIDKTYVDFKGTRFEKTFLNESGWDALKDLVRETHYGLTASETVKEVMNETFGRMALEYVKMALRELGWNV